MAGDGREGVNGSVARPLCGVRASEHKAGDFTCNGVAACRDANCERRGSGRSKSGEEGKEPTWGIASPAQY